MSEGASKAFSGWKLPTSDRAPLLRQIAPAYDEVCADHVTYEPGDEARAPTRTSRARIVGVADDGRGVQAVVVEIDGTTRRPDGSTYHITWSLAPGRHARESNEVLQSLGWMPLAAIDIRLEPVGLPADMPSATMLRQT